MTVDRQPPLTFAAPARSHGIDTTATVIQFVPMSEPRQESAADWRSELVRTHDAALRRYAWSLLHDTQGAEDAVQETYLRLMKADRDRLADHAGAWLFKVCRTRAYDAIRRRKSHGETDDTPLTWQSDPAPSPASDIERADATALLLRLVDSLGENQREIMRLKFQAGLSNMEIAEILDKTPNLVAVTVHQSIEQLRNLYKQATAQAPRRKH